MISLRNLYASNNIQIEQVLFNTMCVCVWVCGYAITTINEKKEAMQLKKSREGWESIWSRWFDRRKRKGENNKIILYFQL